MVCGEIENSTLVKIKNNKNKKCNIIDAKKKEKICMDNFTLKILIYTTIGEKAKMYNQILRKKMY